MKTPDVICLGTVKLGIPNYGFSSQDSVKDFGPVNFLSQAQLNGIYRFDTSPRYGESEKIIGQYIAKSNATPFISSKIDNLKPNDSNTPKIMIESVKASLQKLNLTSLDICYLHQNDLGIISDSYVHEGISQLKRRGFINYAGASLYSFKECAYAVSSGIFDFIQVPVSVFDLGFYKEFIKNKSGPVRFSARSLLLQGVLANRNRINQRLGQDRKIFEYLSRLDRLAERCGLSTLEMALAFVFSLPNIDHYLIGTTRIENLKKDIQCLNVKLSSQVRKDIFKMALQQKDWTNPRNWSGVNSEVS